MHDIEVDVWYASLDAPGRARLLGALSPDERRRADRFALERDRRRWSTSRALLRYLLARELNAPAYGLRFAYDDAGKPRLDPPAGGAPRFNVAHSGAVALFALCRDADVGVDVEHERTDMGDDEVMAVSRRVLAPEELATLERLSPAERRHEFYRLWVRKEAYLKATGEGLRLDPPLVSVAGPRSEPWVLRPTAGAGASRPWTVVDLPAAAGCAAALVVDGVGVRVRCRQLDGAGPIRAVEPSASERPEAGTPTAR